MKWIKFEEQLAPSNGTEILIAMRNKNLASGIWLFDVCFYLGGNIHDNDNWEGKINWESPLYWCYIEEPVISKYENKINRKYGKHEI